MKAAPKINPASVTCDRRAVLINGRRELLICGEIHYARIPEQEWARILDATKAAGVNCIATYVFWNWHEPRRSQFDFSGPRDLSRWLTLCEERGLHVLLRAGPYCCAEWNYGGFPPWLRDEPGIEFRTFNQPFLERTKNYMRHLFTEITPHLATRGGAIIIVQLENEYANIARRYGTAGDRYLAWMLELGRNEGIDVPIVMCEGGAPGSIESLNGFSLSDTRIAQFQKRCPDQPLIWTELWTGWYNTWGYARHVRDARNLGYHLLRFIAAGGTAWNYYMWHGGTNLGRSSMFLQASAYEFDGPLDEAGRLTPKGHYLRALHELTLSHKSILLDGRIRITPGKTTWHLGRKKLVITWNAEGKQANVTDETGRILFDCQTQTQPALKPLAWRPAALLNQWSFQPEPLPSGRIDAPVLSPAPIEQLLLTRDASDYCWYSHTLTRKSAGRHELHLPHCGDFLRIYVNGSPVAVSALPLKENRGITLVNPPPAAALGAAEAAVNSLENNRSYYGLTCQIFIGKGRNRIDILCTALGLIKGDWSVSGPMATERKGIWDDVLLDGKVLKGWEMRPALAGETHDLFSAACVKAPARRHRRLGWWRTSFELSPRQLNDRHDFRIDLAGWDKGLVYLNGRLVSRYWLIKGVGYGADEGWQEPVENGMSLTADGQPTQQHYRLPTSWLKTSNTLMLFEENAPHAPAAPVVVVEHRTLRA